MISQMRVHNHRKKKRRGKHRHRRRFWTGVMVLALLLALIASLAAFRWGAQSPSPGMVPLDRVPWDKLDMGK